MALAQKALLALGGGRVITDVRLEGAGVWYAGGARQNGPVVFEASGPWHSRADIGGGGRRMAFSLGALGQPQAQWSHADGVAHNQAPHNSFVPAAWFFPLFSPLGTLGDVHSSFRYIGQEQRDGATVEHIRYSRVAAAGSPGALKTLARLSQVDIYLDAQTFLPVALTYNLHPDNDLHTDLPVEVRYSDYRAVPGAGQLPYTVERYMNHGLDLRFTLAQASFNLGLAASEFDLH